MGTPIRAAGGLLYRPAGEGIEVCLVHRPYLGDWSLPKGKLDGDEHPLRAAVREVFEETGLRGRPELRLPEVAYALPDGRPKTVDFWLMRAGEEAAEPVLDVAEVDDVQWLTPAAAMTRLTYPADRELVAYVTGRPPVTAVQALVRHAHAGERKHWTGPDALRPIDSHGADQARAIAGLLTPFRPVRLVAATPLRCRQTLEPLAAGTGLELHTLTELGEEEYAADPRAGLDVVERFLEPPEGPGVRVVCSQGGAIPSVLTALGVRFEGTRLHPPAAKGSVWALGGAPGALVADYYRDVDPAADASGR